tara:strand:- start:290 stop:535 length:246 start_codon:yes stop_codon:yes gene_type:complete
MKTFKIKLTGEFKKYKHTESGEEIEVEELDYIQGLNDTGLKNPLRVITTQILDYEGIAGTPRYKEIYIESEQFKQQYELIN